MCRIAGIVSKTKQADTLYQRVKMMCDRMQHGGPDDEGIYLNPGLGVCLGHRRLSLLDLSNAGHQPMSESDEQLWLSYNGEIYNFKELQKELESFGHIFKTRTDTEVILKAYLQWGTEAFSRFNGMFAFSLMDLKVGKVYLVRDAAGIKPLYYSCSDRELIFASEVKAFKQRNSSWRSNPDWRLLLLAFGHIPEPYTTLENVFSLQKGHFLSYNLSDSSYTINSYRKLGFTLASILSKEEAIRTIREKLQSAVERHLIADAPIGLFLSGGIDSSLLTIMAAKDLKKQLHTLSITFTEDNYSEKVYQQTVVDQVKCQHQFYQVSAKDLEDNFNDILSGYDQPSNDGVNSWFISKCAKENGLKAVLSGIGSDEVFGGYPSFNRMSSLLKLRNFSKVTGLITPYIRDSRFQRLEWLKVNGTTGLYLALRGFYTASEIGNITGQSSKEIITRITSLSFQPIAEDIKKNEMACWLEFNGYMQNQLLKDSDSMSMQHGLELRVPFLDQEFLEAVFSLNTSLLYQHGKLPKQLLIDSFNDILPEIIWNRKKMGFSFPFQHWLGNMKSVRESLTKEKAGADVLKSFDKGKLHWSKLWAYYLMQNFEA
ncbi:asparagine synthase (glutamine-hydrolyzing) [Rubrolithibacter danxiaensis]|uniref:asparagine synthase (glutamine-hydrolyzing) n=1 Tax=Rubrolithibacter danxiaensis TaxID=3390805 RepID=UPI003BF8D8E6